MFLSKFCEQNNSFYYNTQQLLFQQEKSKTNDTNNGDVKKNVFYITINIYFLNSDKTLRRFSSSIGLEIWAFIPTSFTFLISSWKAFAVCYDNPWQARIPPARQSAAFFLVIISPFPRSYRPKTTAFP